MKKNIITLVFTALLVGCSTPKENKTQSGDAGSTIPEKKEIALQLYSLRDEISKDYNGVITKVGEMGYTAVESADYSDGKFYNRTPEEFKSDLSKAGLVFLSSHTNRELSDVELASKNFTEALKWWDQAIDAHKTAGVQYIVDPWISVPKTLKDLQTYCEYLNEIGKKCQEKGLKFGYHNHAHEFTKIEDKMMYDYMLENTNPEYVFFEMDVYWTVRGQQSPVEYFKKYPGRFTLLHIKDDKELGESGMVGFDAILKNTDKAGTKYLIVEVEKYDYAPLESVKISLDYLLNCPLVKTKY